MATKNMTRHAGPKSVARALLKLKVLLQAMDIPLDDDQAKEVADMAYDVWDVAATQGYQEGFRDGRGHEQLYGRNAAAATTEEE